MKDIIALIEIKKVQIIQEILKVEDELRKSQDEVNYSLPSFMKLLDNRYDLYIKDTKLKEVIQKLKEVE